MTEPSILWKPCFDCGSMARVRPFDRKDNDYAHHETPQDCIRELGARVKQLERRRENTASGGHGSIAECEAAKTRIAALEEVLLDAERVYKKFGANSDWTEWRDLGESLAKVKNTASGGEK